MFTVVSFYTPDYQELNQRMVESAWKYDLPVVSKAIQETGSWKNNTCFKPGILKNMMNIIGTDLLYVDADAEFMNFPDLFFNWNGADIGLHYHKGTIPASGTIYLRLNHRVQEFLNRWHLETNPAHVCPDQNSLASILANRPGIEPTPIPKEYCWIAGTTRMNQDEDKAVIYHHQASRQFRNKEPVE